jgi:hypothetical protein
MTTSALLSSSKQAEPAYEMHDRKQGKTIFKLFFTVSQLK